jgi:uncharacterized spore protein YtfJ
MDIQQNLTQAIEPIEKMMKGLSVNTVFGEAIKDGEQTVIPVATVSYAFGYGSGWGSGQSESENEPPKSGEGGGGGGGGAGKATPQGVIHITPEGVDFEAAMDPKAVALAGIAMVAWNVFWITATVRAFARR